MRIKKEDSIFPYRSEKEIEEKLKAHRECLEKLGGGIYSVPPYRVFLSDGSHPGLDMTPEEIEEEITAMRKVLEHSVETWEAAKPNLVPKDDVRIFSLVGGPPKFYGWNKGTEVPYDTGEW